MSLNVLPPERLEMNIARLLSLVGQPARILILMVIMEQDACVCHLEAVLKIRQTRISQHLMDLRRAGLVTCHRDGRNIYYHLARPDIIKVLEEATHFLGGDSEALRSLAVRPISNCPCPYCNPDIDP